VRWVPNTVCLDWLGIFAFHATESAFPSFSLPIFLLRCQVLLESLVQWTIAIDAMYCSLNRTLNELPFERRNTLGTEQILLYLYFSSDAQRVV
jgi:hypothetical protein